MQHLCAARDTFRPFGERRHEITVVRRRPFNDRYATDRQTHMGIGILGLQKARVQRREVLHAETMRSAAVVDDRAASPQSVGTTSRGPSGDFWGGQSSPRFFPFGWSNDLFISWQLDVVLSFA